MADRGLTTDQSYLFETMEMAHGKYDRKAKKDKNTAAFGWDVFNQDTLYKAYEKRLAHLPTHADMNEAADSSLNDELAYGKVSSSYLIFHHIHICPPQI
jgi:hypothetical protein